MMDLGYVVIAVLVVLFALVIWSWRGQWSGKRGEYQHNPLPGHRQEGSSGDDDTGSDWT